MLALPVAKNSGVRPGVVLTAFVGQKEITAPGVVEGLDISEGVVISASGVTLRNCRIRGTSWAIVLVLANAPNTLIEFCDILSINHAGGAKGIEVDGATRCRIRRNDISNVEDGIYASGSGHIFQDNYIHNLHADSADPHYDGIQLVGGESHDIKIFHNNVDVAIDDNSAVGAGNVMNVLIDSNRMSGGGYTCYIDGRFGSGACTGNAVTNNRFGTHTFGYMSFEAPCAPVVTGNVDDVTGLPI